MFRSQAVIQTAIRDPIEAEHVKHCSERVMRTAISGCLQDNHHRDTQNTEKQFKLIRKS